MVSAYRIVMSFHIIAVISWMAGLLYLWRLFVYHVEEQEPIVKTRFEMMELRLYRIITFPAMLVAFLLGVTMIVMNPSLLEMHWLHAKLFFAALLVGVTYYSSRVRESLRLGTCKLSSRNLRILNELPTLLMIVIVLLVILRLF